MWWLLIILRSLSRLKRRVFKSTTPHWFNDALPLISYVNVLDLLPTLFAITLAPGHFYARLPRYILSKRSWFKTPVKFLTSGATLIVSLLLFLAPDTLAEAGVADKRTLALYVTAICLTAPLWIPAICLIFEVLFALAALSNLHPAPPPILTGLLVPLSPWTYSRLDYNRFLWSIFYYGVYFFIALQVLLLIGFYELIALKSIVGASSSSEFFQLLLGPLGIFALIGYALLINPYLWLLRASVIIPTKLMHRGYCYNIRGLIAEFTRRAKRGKWEQIARRLGLFARRVADLEKIVAVQDRKARNSVSNYLGKLKEERSEVFEKLLRTDGLRPLLESGAVPPEIRGPLCPSSTG